MRVHEANGHLAEPGAVSIYIYLSTFLSLYIYIYIYIYYLNSLAMGVSKCVSTRLTVISRNQAQSSRSTRRS